MSEMELKPGYFRPKSEELPSGWEAVRLGDYCEIVQGGQSKITKEKDYQDSGIPAFSAAGQDGFVSEAEFKDREGVILSSIGAHCGKTFFAQGDWTTLANIQAILPKGRIDPKFLFYRTNASKYWLRSGSAQPFISPTSVQSSWLAAPPLPEQKKIAEILSTVDRKIEKTEALIAKNNIIKQGVMSDLLLRGIDHTGHIRPSYEENPSFYSDSAVGPIPTSWSVERGENLFSLEAGGMPTQFRHDSSGESLYLKVEDFNRPGNRKELSESQITFNPDNNASTKLIEPGALVFPKRGAAIFINRIQPLERSATLDPNLMALRAKPGVDSDWLRYKLLHFGLGNICDNSGIPQINNKHLYPLLLSKPPFEEQKKISRIIKAFDSFTVLEELNHTKLLSVKTGLMRDLLTGKVRVNLDEVEEAMADA